MEFAKHIVTPNHEGSKRITVVRGLAITGVLLVGLIALVLSALSRREDLVFTHFRDLEVWFTANTNDWQLTLSGTGSSGDFIGGGNAHALMVVNRRIDTGRFITNAANLIRDYVVAQGGVVLDIEETGRRTFAPDYHSEGADSAGHLILYRSGAYHGTISARITVFDLGREAGHVYLEQASLRSALSMTEVMDNLSRQFGITIPHVLVPPLLWVITILWIVATVRVARAIRGWIALAWILFALAVPVLGPIAAMIAAHREAFHAPTLPEVEAD